MYRVCILICGESMLPFLDHGSQSLLASGACLRWVRQTKVIFLGCILVTLTGTLDTLLPAPPQCTEVAIAHLVIGTLTKPLPQLNS